MARNFRIPLNFEEVRQLIQRVKGYSMNNPEIKQIQDKKIYYISYKIK